MIPTRLITQAPPTTTAAAVTIVAEVQQLELVDRACYAEFLGTLQPPLTLRLVLLQRSPARQIHLRYEALRIHVTRLCLGQVLHRPALCEGGDDL